MKDLCVRESYQKNGEEKVRWNKIGVLFESNGKAYIKLFHMPGVLVSVFEPKPKEEKQDDPNWLPEEQ
jgi:hypothetical protein